MDTLAIIEDYAKKIDKLYQSNHATEYTYRQEFVNLLRALLPGCDVHNEEKHQDCGAPDITIRKNNLALSFVETKPINDNDLDGDRYNSEQFNRYKNALNTVIFTNFRDFHLYNNGELTDKVELLMLMGKRLVLNPHETMRFVSIIEKLRESKPQPITSAKRLAELMATKARLLATEVEGVLKIDTEKTGKLWMQLNSFKEVLLSSLTEKEFADLYAQTICYGLFAARIHDKTPENFTRIEAATLIPYTNPFLREFFQQIAGLEIDSNIAWIVDDLVNVFAATNISKILKGFGKSEQRTDPLLHFYEDFLAQYDPSSKKKYGVYYTPQPVVQFIVGAVDDILKHEFHVADGLADTNKTDVTVRKIKGDVETNETETFHRVQILDPATGTGTFLAEVVQRIKETQQKGTWASYVDEHLLPRLNGFEIMMAPYTIAHLKVDMLLNWWGDERLDFEHKERLRIYLTNSLDQSELTNKHSLAAKIADEANQANNIKLNTPVMVMLGNPPYSVSSNNRDIKWINSYLNDYKKDLNEKKLNLDDDYIKFIRLGQYFVEKTGEGVLAYISNNSFIDGITHRQMRKELMRCFDKIYILDLHGNTRKKETCPDGSKDENVFSIMQGVSINIFVKTDKHNDQPAQVFNHELYGTRKEKYEYLLSHDILNTPWVELIPKEPYYFFVPKDFSATAEYKNGFKVDELMHEGNSGFKTDRDSLFIDIKKDQLAQRIQLLLGGNLTANFIDTYNVKDSSSYNLTERIKRISYNKDFITQCQYRPFDYQYIYYDTKLISRPAEKALKHIVDKNNIALITIRSESAKTYTHTFCTIASADLHIIGGQSYLFPLYLYPDKNEIAFEEQQERTPNLDENIWRTIENYCQYGQAYKPLTQDEQNGQLGFDAEPEQPHFLTPEDIFDYIYGYLHSPAYRERYKEFLKVDFPRVPYPDNQRQFDYIAHIGHQLRELHLMHNLPASKDIPYAQFNVGGSDKVEDIRYDYGKVWINDKQYFDNVPPVAWEFFIGGYQPAQKWLKDRKADKNNPERKLANDDFKHYQRIIYVLMETDRLMHEIDTHPFQHKPSSKQGGEQKGKVEIHYHIDHVDIKDSEINIEKFNQ